MNGENPIKFLSVLGGPINVLGSENDTTSLTVHKLPVKYLARAINELRGSATEN